MSKQDPASELPPKDQLVTRPDQPLPTVPDPKRPRGEPVDPKPIPPGGQADPAEANKIGRTA